MGQCLDQIQNAKYFSTVDLAQGYHQVPLRKEDQEKTAFSFLGHEVSSDGIRPPDDIATKLAHWTKLESVKELQSFLSMCSWWRKFIKNYSTIAYPLQKLIQTGKFQWSDEAQSAFEKLKHVITNAPVLIHPDHSTPFIVHSDASQ